VVLGRGCNPHRSLWRHLWRHNSKTIRDREKRRPPLPMKSSEHENCIALWQRLQNRKLRHLWRHWGRNRAVKTNRLVCVFVNRSVVERLRPRFFIDFHQILHAAQKCGRFDAYCFLDKLKVIIRFQRCADSEPYTMLIFLHLPSLAAMGAENSRETPPLGLTP